VSKISGFKSAVSNKLVSITNPVSFQDTSHTGPILHTCQPVTTAEVLRILHFVPPKSSSVDFVPPSLVKSCAAVFAKLIAELANRSLSNGCFLACFKHAAITPLLKKPTLDTFNPSSYRLISNLDFISKILERLFLARLKPHILACSNFNHHQSAYRPRHSTETSLLSTLDNIYRASDIGSSTLLVSLDFSAAFDTIDHVTLINRLRTSFGITGSVLSWLQSYLSNKTQSVRIGHHSSTPTRCTIDVPQGSVLGPLLFATYTSPIATITRSFQVCHQQYADDTQLFIALNPSDLSSGIANLTSCLHALHSWFCLNEMALNPDKSNAMLLGTLQRSKTFASVRSVAVAGCSVLLSHSIKILGVILDCHLSLDKHISFICKSAYYHIRSLRHIRSAITDDMAKSVASSLVCSRLDYANSLLFGTTQKNINRF